VWGCGTDILTIKNLSFQYEAASENALRNVDLDIRKGECIVLTGESGCGKTTLTRCVNGLIPNFFEGRLTGEILYEGKPIGGMDQYALSSRIGSVFQDPRSQFFTVNTTDEVAFGCENLAFSTECINRNVDRAFSRMNINALRDRSLFELSSGEKQRLAVASIYAMGTDVILLDEPTANLDGETIQNLRELLSSLKAEGKTLVISEHRLSWLGGLADRYVYMKDGKIERIWSLQEAVQLSSDALREYGLRSIKEVPLPQRKPSARAGENQLVCRDLCVCYGRREIIHDLNLCVTWGGDGKIVGIVGENGSGKTTFSKVLCGLMESKSGTISLNGKQMNDKMLVRSTYFVMQDADYQLFTESVAHEIELAARKNDPRRTESAPPATAPPVTVPPPTAPTATEHILTEFGLEAFPERHPLALSGGQKQRVTIAAAIAARSGILVLDEPTSGLDGRNMQRLKATLHELRRQGRLVFIVTHDAEFLDGLADEVMTLSNKDKEVTMGKRGKRGSPLWGILRFARQRKGLLRVSVVLSVLSSAFGMLPYAAVAVLLGKALGDTLSAEWAIGLTLTVLAGYFLKHFLYSKSTLCSHKAAYEIIRNIRCAIMRKMSRMPLGTIQEKSSGEFKQLVIDDTDRLEGQIAHAIPEMTASILIPLLVFGYLFFVDWRMALASLASAVLGNLIYYGMMIGRSERMREYMSANGDMNATIVEYVNGMEVIRMFNQTASSMGRFKSAVLKVRDITTAWYRHCYPFMSISQVVMPSTIAFVLPVGIALMSVGAVTLSEVILCILLSMGLVGSLQAMIEFWQDIAAIYEIQPRIQALLDAKELPEPAEPQQSVGSDVELKDIHFSYEAKEVIHGISFTAKAGTVTALVGPSGSGKSTLAKLIARFWDVSAGAVRIGGADIRNLPLSELAERISYVSQDNFLFNMSLRDNVRIGKPEATDAEVEKAASQTGCDEFIARFPKGYDTDVGDAGARLSGGERQRLAIARAILKDAPIVILDEATAFTDPENEDKLQSSINQLTKGKTLIVIAHRLSTVMYADQIIVLCDGVISAAGTHEQLLSSSQTYLEMWKAHISAMDWSVNREVAAS
jgi:ABC-type multidrug transport system fused ATPase/permease subunit